MSQKYKCIRGGRIITATEDFVGDILIGDGQVLAVGKDLKALGLKNLGPDGRLQQWGSRRC